MKTLTLAIVIPVYNEEDHLKQCLDAILKQSEAPDEVFVIDNNSSDNTVAIAQRYSLVTLISEPRQGVVYARNTGFNAVTSDIIGRIDADTVLPEDWIKRVKTAFRDSTLHAMTGPVSYYDMPLSRHNHHVDHAVRNLMSRKMSKYPFFYGSNAALRRSVWEMVADSVCIDSRIHEDLDLAIHLQQAGYTVAYDPKMLSGVSARRYDDGFSDFRRYMRMFIDSYRLHDRQGLAPYLAVSAYTTGYIALQPMRMTYDTQSRRHSLRNVLKKRTARKNPNAS